MEQRELTVKMRNDTGKGATRKLRREGFVPAVFYGHKTKPIALSINPSELRKILNAESGRSTFIKLKFEGGKEGDRIALLKDMQFRPLKKEYLHLDLYEVLMDEKITARVPIHFAGKSMGAKEGGIEQHSRRELDVRCLPGNLPDFIEVDVSNLDIGGSIHVSDLTLPKGVEVLDPPGDTIVSIVAPTVEKILTPEEAEAQLAASLAEPKKEEKKEEKPKKEK